MKKLAILLALMVAAVQLSYATTFYVRPDGTDQSNGTANTPTGAWKTIKHAATQLAGGNHTVYVADGTYYEDEIKFNYPSNTKNTPIILKSINKHGAKIIATSPQYHAMNLGGSVGITIDGFDITFVENTTSEQHGINFEGNWITIKNCKIHGVPFTGIQGYLCDNATIENNIIYSNCKGTGRTVHENGSGISIYHPKLRESNSGFHFIIRNNILYDNVATNNVSSTGKPTDGNGIILDDFEITQNWDADQTGGVKYTQPTLIENNLCYNNGGRGIHVFNSKNATLRNNTCYYNNYILDANGHYSADIQIEGAGCSLYNNIAVQNPGLSSNSRAIKIYNQTPPCERNLFVGTIEGTIGSNNITYAKGAQASVKFINPSTDPAVANFRLQSTSPAVNAGYNAQKPSDDLDGKIRPANNTVDIGCYEYGDTTNDTQPPTVPTGLASSAITQNSFTLSWTTSTDNTGVTSYEVFRGGISVGTTATTSISVTGLTCNTAYSMTVKARDAAGNWSAASTALNVTTSTCSAADAQIPNTSTPITIDGTTDAAYSGTAYAINNVISGTVSSTADLSATWKSVWDNTNIYFIIEVTDDTKVNDSGTSWWDDDVVEIFIDADNSKGTTYGANDFQFAFRYNDATIRETKHSAITGVVKSAGDITGGYRLEVKIPWSALSVTPAQNNLIGIDVQVDDDDDGGSRDGKRAWYGTNDNAWQNPGLLASAQLTGGTTDTQAPTVPSGLSSSAITQTSFTLSWNASSDNVGVTAYEVFKDGASVGTTASTSMSITGLTCGTAYNMTVKAQDAAGNTSAASSALTVTTLNCPDTQPPTTPTGLASTAITQNSFTLSWTASTDNTGVTGYEVFRGGISVGTTATTSISVTGLTCNTAYSMTVKARDAAGNWSAASTALNVTTSTCSAADAQIPNTSTPITIDGTTDAAYSGNAYAINNVISGTVSSTADLSATWKSIWDNTNLYFMIEVTDDTKVNDSGTSWWDDDVVEIFIDADNSKGTTYGANDFQFAFRYNDATIRETKHSAITGVVKSGTDFSGGYRLEIKIPWSTLSVTPAQNNLIGIDVQVDDDDDGGARDGKKAWYGTNDNAWQNPGLLASAQLTGGTTDTQAPTVPSGLSSSAITQTSFTLSWNASSDNVGVTAYEVFKDGASIGTTASTSMNVTGLTASATYAMTVKARDAAGNWSAASTALNVTTSAATSNNLLLNGDFENGTNNWTGGGCTLTAVTSPVYAGSKAVKVSGRSANWAGPNQNIKTIVTNNGQGDYYVEAYVRTTSGTASFHITAQLNGSTTVWKTTADVTCNSNSWTKVSGVLNLTYSGTLTAANFYVETASGNAEYTIDDCYMRKGTMKSASLAVEDMQPDAVFQSRVYPNPTDQGFATLQLSGKNNNEKVIVKVLDAEGRIHKTIESVDNEIVINTRELIPGLYFIRIEHSKNLIVKKLMVD